MRILMVVVLAVIVHACGRIGFDVTAHSDGGLDGAAAPSDALVEDDGPSGACGWQPCGTGLVACCVGSLGSCAMAGACAGAAYQCDNSLGGRCAPTTRCCQLPSGGSQCINLNTICDPM